MLPPSLNPPPSRDDIELPTPAILPSRNAAAVRSLFRIHSIVGSDAASLCAREWRKSGKGASVFKISRGAVASPQIGYPSILHAYAFKIDSSFRLER
eukprot:1917286-Rhodomonas_salina.4